VAGSESDAVASGGEEEKVPHVEQKLARGGVGESGER
jgi:hypothetical protein